jgi:hypothetical protein
MAGVQAGAIRQQRLLMTVVGVLAAAAMLLACQVVMTDDGRMLALSTAPTRPR